MLRVIGRVAGHPFNYRNGVSVSNGSCCFYGFTAMDGSQTFAGEVRSMREAMWFLQDAAKHSVRREGEVQVEWQSVELIWPKKEVVALAKWFASALDFIIWRCRHAPRW